MAESRGPVVLATVERDFIAKCATAGLRIDGRLPDQARDLNLRVIAPGTVLAKLGDTQCLAAAKADIVRPHEARPAEGVLKFDVSYPDVHENRDYRSDRELELRALVENCFRRSRAVDVESLCIVSEEQVWQVTVDVHVVDDDGNASDCALLACAAALKTFRRPDVAVQGSEVRVYGLRERQPVPLSLHHMPLAVTFALFDRGVESAPSDGSGVAKAGSGELLAALDPQAREEWVADGLLTFAINAQSQMTALRKTGSAPLPPDLLYALVAQAEARARSLQKEVNRTAKLSLDLDDRLPSGKKVT